MPTYFFLKIFVLELPKLIPQGSTILIFTLSNINWRLTYFGLLKLLRMETFESVSLLHGQS